MYLCLYNLNNCSKVKEFFLNWFASPEILLSQSKTTVLKSFIDPISAFISAVKGAIVLQGSTATTIIYNGIVIVVPLIGSVLLLNHIEEAHQGGIALRNLMERLHEILPGYMEQVSRVHHLAEQITEIENIRGVDPEWNGDPELDGIERAYRALYEQTESLFRRIRSLEIQIIRYDPQYVPTRNPLQYLEPQEMAPHLGRMPRGPN